MPDKEEKTVNLDTSGPGARVELPETENEETKTYENKDNKNEANVIYDDQPADTSEKSSEQSNVKSTSLDKNYATEMEGRISSSLTAAQEKLKAARLNEDAKAEVEALTQISQLGYEQGKLAELKTQHQMQETAAKERPVRTQQPINQSAPVDPKAEAWAEKNEWFGKDNAMTYTAFDLHRKLTEEEGMDPQSDEYYAEVDK